MPVAQPPSDVCVTPAQSGSTCGAGGDTPIIRRLNYKRVKRDSGESNENCLMQLVNDVGDLKQLVKQLVDENFVLKKELREIKNLVSVTSCDNVYNVEAVRPVASYANIVKTQNKVVVINPKRSQDSNVTKQVLLDKLKPEHFAARDVRNSKSGGLIVECATSEDRNKLRSSVANVLGEDYSVSVPTKRLPRHRIFGLSCKYSEDEFHKMFLEQNNHLLHENSSISVVHIFQSKNNSQFGVIVEVDTASFDKLVNVGKVFIGWDSCWINEDLNIRRCFKCYGFNHTMAKCKSDIFRCPNCAGNHQRNNCTSISLSCVACIDAASKTNMKLNSSHSALDEACPTYLHRVALQRRHTNYAI